MNRRQMVVLPGIAFAATRAFAQTDQAISATASTTLSHKAMARYSSPKWAYKIPKTEAKQTKYIAFLTAYLGLTGSQQSEAASIFTAARTSTVSVKARAKVARMNLRETVRQNDTAGINSASVTMGTASAQKRALGATANAALFQILAASQQEKLIQLRSPASGPTS